MVEATKETDFGYEGDGFRLLLFLRCDQLEALPQFFDGVCPVHDFIPADHPADLAAALRHRVAGVLVNPP